MLDAPASEEDLYLDRGEIDPYRPICQGDVFAPIQIPGRDGDCMAMVWSHPCAMRSGPRLRERVTVIPVLPHAHIPFDRWPTGNYRLMPLPNLTGEDEPHAGLLEEPTTVRSDLLDPSGRVALLTDTGLMLFQQRLVHNQTRVVVESATLHEACASVLEELELHENWNLALVKPPVEGGADLLGVLNGQAEQFDALMSSVPEGSEISLRDELRDPASRASVRRAVGKAIEMRRA